MCRNNLTNTAMQSVHVRVRNMERNYRVRISVVIEAEKLEYQSVYRVSLLATSDIESRWPHETEWMTQALWDALLNETLTDVLNKCLLHLHNILQASKKPLA